MEHSHRVAPAEKNRRKLCLLPDFCFAGWQRRHRNNCLHALPNDEVATIERNLKVGKEWSFPFGGV